MFTAGVYAVGLTASVLAVLIGFARLYRDIRRGQW